MANDTHTNCGCPHGFPCGSRREPHDCNWHDGIKKCINDRCLLHRAMRTLAENLAIAGPLCKAFVLGGQHADAIWDVDAWEGQRIWRPGCGKQAP